MTVIVRDIVPEDQDVWRTLFRAYGKFYETDLTDEVIDNVWSAIRGEAIRGYVAVRSGARSSGAGSSGAGSSGAQQDGVVIGFAHVRTHVTTFSIGEGWYLEDLYVDPAARAGGVGTAIIEHIVKLARREGGAGLRWITAESNTTAQRVYDKLAKRTTWVTYEIEFGDD